MSRRHPCGTIATLLVALAPQAVLAQTALINFTWGDPALNGMREWRSAAPNSFPDPSLTGNDTRISQQAGSNGVAWFNSDFAEASDYGPGTADDCATPLPQYELITVRKYGCRHADNDLYYAPAFRASPVSGAGPVGMAQGIVAWTRTTLEGILSVVATTDEPMGATTTLIPGGLRTSESPGDGSNGFNLRVADGSPFGNAWYGVTTAATLSLNLTGTFSWDHWTIDGGTVSFNDPGFACQQGGSGGDGRGVLCSASTTGGGFQNNGAHLSWGMDKDGAGTGFLVPSPIEVRDETGSTVLATLSGVLAHLTLDQAGNITTDDGEIRTATGSAGQCSDHVRWGGDTDPGAGVATGISCGTLASAPLLITGVWASTGDTNPDFFSFATQADAPLSTVMTSEVVTITGMDSFAPISVSGSATTQYSINGGPFTSEPDFVFRVDTIAVRHTSASSAATVVHSSVRIGDATAVFTSVTAPSAGTGPDPFHFTDLTRVALSSTITSDPVILSGLAAPTPALVSGAPFSSFSVNGGSFSAATRNVVSGDSIRVRHTSPYYRDTTTGTVLTVGSVSDAFTSTTTGPGSGDTDTDGILDVDDNCTLLGNPDQRDADGDGYGSRCDGDLNNSGRVTATDYSMMRARIGTSDANADLDGSGLVTSTDVNILRLLMNRPPGPSGLRP